MLACSIVLVPGEVVKTRMQAGAVSYRISPIILPTCRAVIDVASSVGGFDGECDFSDIEVGWSARAVHRLLRHTDTRCALHDAGAGGIREHEESAAKSQKSGSARQERRASGGRLHRYRAEETV